MPQSGSSTPSARVAAIDLGGSSGRVVSARVGPDSLVIEGLSRFENVPRSTAGELRWDLDRLLGDASAALREWQGEHRFDSIGIDSWSVDYALLAEGRHLEQPFHQRDPRTRAAFEAVNAAQGLRALFERTGQCALPFLTRYQLIADRDRGALDRADQMLLIPDYLAYRLTGVAVAELTNASTTGLVDWRTGDWDDRLIEDLRLPRHLFAPVIRAGSPLAEVSAAAERDTGIRAGTRVTAVATHDTASAVAALPTDRDDVAFVSSGTWSLVGVETAAPVISEEARLAGFTNESGLDGRNRFLHISAGLWILNQCLSEWGLGRPGQDPAVDALFDAAAAQSAPAVLIDPASPIFVQEGDMLARVIAQLEERGGHVPHDRAGILRVVIESLADTFATVALRAGGLAGKRVSVIHIVGGGSRNRLLCRLVAERSGLPVIAGPAEATAIGNLLVQARAHGAISGGLSEMRELVRRSFPPLSFAPKARARS